MRLLGGLKNIGEVFMQTWQTVNTLYLFNSSCNYYFRVPTHVGMYTEVVCTKVELYYSTHETYIMSETNVTLIEKKKILQSSSCVVPTQL